MPNAAEILAAENDAGWIERQIAGHRAWMKSGRGGPMERANMERNLRDLERALEIKKGNGGK